jgi:hypothetical protein
MKIFIKKVPDNEIGTGTEIAILKNYFDNNLIDDPKDLIGSDENEGSKSYPIYVKFDNKNYKYLIKAYKTQDYGKDRRLIINYSADPLGTKRKKGDYLCYIYEDKITRNSAVEIKIISKDNNSFELIENRYDTRSGLVADNNNFVKFFMFILDIRLNSLYKIFVTIRRMHSYKEYLIIK